MKKPWTTPTFKNLNNSSINSGTGTAYNFEYYVRIASTQVAFPCLNTAGTAQQADGAPPASWQTPYFYVAGTAGCSSGAACTATFPGTVVCS